MNKKFVTISVMFLLLAMLAFNAQPAMSTPTSNSSQTLIPPKPITDSIAIDNSTLPTVSLLPLQTLEEQQLFWDFLNEVVGLNTNNYNADYFNAIPNEVDGSKKAQTSISAILSNDQATLNIAMVIVDGKVRFYDLNIASGTLEDISSTANGYLTASRAVINQYKTNFKADYCADLAQLIPTTNVQTGKTSIENEKLLLTVEYSKESNSAKYAELCWYQKIGDLTTPAISVQATFAETGLLTSFADNMGVYKIATTKIALTEKDAIDLSLSLINEYADANSRTVVSVDAELAYVSDYYSVRGDKFLVYPQWTVSATFDNPNQEDIYGYSVLIWGDSGEINAHGAQGDRQALQNEVAISSTYQYALILALVMTTMSICVVTYKRAKNTNVKLKSLLFKAGGILIAVSLCTLIVAQPVLAAPATILGSPFYFTTQDERDVDLALVNDLNTWCAGVGYTVYNWYNAGTTANNMYIAAYDHGDMGSLVYYTGDGTDNDGYAIADGAGNLINATSIYNNSVANSVGHKKVVVMWACYQGDSINGMPRAWLHTTSLSSNGYTTPDYSGQAFIGWNGPAPYLTSRMDGVNNAGDAFLREFYINALYRGFDLRNSLNFAAQTVWNVNFENCIFYTGTGSGNMVLYGQGTMYIGYAAYATSITSWDSGYSSASGVFNRNNLLGSQSNGQFAQLYAGNYGDYAFVATELNRQASGAVYLWANTGVGYYSHITVYVSNNGASWTAIGDGYILNETPGYIYCGSASNFRYVAIGAQDDVGWSASVYIDSIHVTS